MTRESESTQTAATKKFLKTHLAPLVRLSLHRTAPYDLELVVHRVHLWCGQSRWEHLITSENSRTYPMKNISINEIKGHTPWAIAGYPSLPPSKTERAQIVNGSPKRRHHYHYVHRTWRRRGTIWTPNLIMLTM